MKTRTLRDIKVSEVGVGCMAEQYSIEAIRNAYKHGCTLFDTAEIYSPNLAGIGHNERYFGDLLLTHRRAVHGGRAAGTSFSDPMMGLSYEREPILERLQAEYGDRLEIRYVMSVLVRDVADFMTSEERNMKPEVGVRRYCKRLAQIYKSEEKISDPPINMEGFRLFFS